MKGYFWTKKIKDPGKHLTKTEGKYSLTLQHDTWLFHHLNMCWLV